MIPNNIIDLQATSSSSLNIKLGANLIALGVGGVLPLALESL